MNILIACEKFKLKLVDYVQCYLIGHHQTWLFQNFTLIQRVSFKYSEFTILQDFWTTTVCAQPEIIFEAADFISIDKELLLSLCRNENFYVEGCELWNHIIRWGKAQNTELPEEIENWSSNDFEILKKIIDDFMPHIKFYDISSEDFFFKVIPYSKVLSNDLYQDILKYHLVTNQQKSSDTDSEQAMLISSWKQK